MKKLLIALTCLSFAGCAANPAVYGTVKQNYRPKGEDKPLSIESRLVVKQNLLDKDFAVLFNVDNKMQLAFNLDQQGNGSLSCTTPQSDTKGGFMCEPHNGHKIGASCIGSTANGRFASTQCAFTYDDEIAANFKF